MVVPYGDVVTVEHGEAGKPANRIEVIVQDRYSRYFTAIRPIFGGCIADLARSAIAGGME